MKIVHFNIEEASIILQRLYDSEINIEITSIWDNEFDARLGDKKNGYKTFEYHGHLSRLDSRKIEDVVSAMAYTAYKEFPTSEFANWYKHRLSQLAQ